ncbi:unnamed protein product [Ixodes pacificus]
MPRQNKILEKKKKVSPHWGSNPCPLRMRQTRYHYATLQLRKFLYENQKVSYRTYSPFRLRCTTSCV